MNNYRIVQHGSQWVVIDAETRRIRFTSRSAMAATRKKLALEQKAEEMAAMLERNIPVREWSRRSGG